MSADEVELDTRLPALALVVIEELAQAGNIGKHLVDEVETLFREAGMAVQRDTTGVGRDNGRIIPDA
jgi:hypothetical protein